MAIYHGRDGKKYEPGKELKSGGEGHVCLINGQPQSVAKIYKPEILANTQLRDNIRDKILAMLDMSFNPYYNGNLMVAWPEDILYDSAGQFQGFVMPKVSGMKSLIWSIRPSDREILWPKGYRWSYSVIMAYNLAAYIEMIHQRGIIIGDLNTNNILIDATGNVTLIDAGSFNITSRGGRVFKCVVGFPEVLPPELQGKDLTKPTSRFTEKSDCFSLAVHIFNLLCNNCHPFGVLTYVDGHKSSSSPTIVNNIVKGSCPYVNGSSATADDALDMNVFPADLRELFGRAFRYDVNTAVKPSTIANRPSAHEWRMALSSLYSAGFRKCTKNPLHEYPAGYRGTCPWCAIERRKEKPIPPPPPPIPPKPNPPKPTPPKPTPPKPTPPQPTPPRPQPSAPPQKKKKSFFGILVRLALIVSFVILVLYLNDNRGMDYLDFYEYCLGEAINAIGSLFKSS